MCVCVCVCVYVSADNQFYLFLSFVENNNVLYLIYTAPLLM